MGATGFYTDKPTRRVVEDAFTWAHDDGHKARVLDYAFVAGVAYFAWERTYPACPRYPAGKTFVIGGVCPVTRRAGEVIVREQTEDMGPCDTRCPARILDQLSPVGDFETPGSHGHEWATKWRAACRENLKRRAEAPREGAMIRFPEPIEFTDGAKYDLFRLSRGGRKGQAWRFAPVDAEGNKLAASVYCISNWQARDFEVVTTVDRPAAVTAPLFG